MDFEPSISTANTPLPRQYTIDDPEFYSPATELRPPIPEQKDEGIPVLHYPDPTSLGAAYNPLPSPPSEESIPSVPQTETGRTTSPRKINRPRRRLARPYDGFPTQIADPAQQIPAQSKTSGVSGACTSTNLPAQPFKFSAGASSSGAQKTPDDMIDPLLRDLLPGLMKIPSFLAGLEAQSASQGDATVQGNSSSHGNLASQKQPEKVLESPASPIEPAAQPATYADEEMSDTEELARALEKEMADYAWEDEAEEVAAAEAAAKAAAKAAAGTPEVEAKGALLYEWFQQAMAQASSTGGATSPPPIPPISNPVISPFNPQSQHTVSAEASNPQPTSWDAAAVSRGIYTHYETSSDDETTAQPAEQVPQQPRKIFNLQSLGRRRKGQNQPLPNQHHGTNSEPIASVGGSNPTDGNDKDENAGRNKKQTRTSAPTSSSTNEASSDDLPNFDDLYEQGIKDHNQALRDIKKSTAKDEDEESDEDEPEPPKTPPPGKMGQKRTVTGKDAGGVGA
ncbi:MAG: hypothetical protein Q9223_005155, partial [Gallowayella weberi]